VLRRADEPGELLAYWTSMYGRAIPKPIKRGVADAVLRLGTEFNYVKWDSEGRGYRFADILNVTHPGDRKGSAALAGSSSAAAPTPPAPCATTSMGTTAW
jgi:hypothetical protein